MAVSTAAESFLGKRVPRVDGPEKVTGQARFGDDLALYGLLHARIVPSIYAHARIKSIDATQALAHPGVVGVVTADDLASIIKAAPTNRAREALAKGVTRFCGQPVAAVIAESEAAAEDAIALVDVEYEELPAVLDPLGRARAGRPRRLAERRPRRESRRGRRRRPVPPVARTSPTTPATIVATSQQASPRPTSSSSAPTAPPSSTRATSSPTPPPPPSIRSATSPSGPPATASSCLARRSPGPSAGPSTASGLLLPPSAAALAAKAC